MRMLVIGGAGMLGHQLARIARESLDVWITVRDDGRGYARYNLIDADRVIGRVAVGTFDSVVSAVARSKPDVIVNCIGVVKQRDTSDVIGSLTINSLFPHRLAALAGAAGARLIHISTDCVFLGTKGGYTERDVPDARDLYGLSKHLGEVTAAPSLTLRTSIIGRELATTQGLVEWFLSAGSHVRGFRNAIFSGWTTIALSRVIVEVATRRPDLAGLYHVAAQPISKLDLLTYCNEAFGLGTTITPDDSLVIDRSLDGAAFAAATGIVAPLWTDMVAEMAAASAQYDDWRMARRRDKTAQELS